ncbi:hypothetical protein [Bacillus sp. AFS055030]|uniref:hypothetical protein n=1 Tax=Bacillus sp. AFS055030 TaxID=2033507 RepID=UPI000BFDBDA4|nr:hypothetical protein [Bacillus sp. AFS055030]PGL68861.1 hypothetical protein CN925_17470 [Bacillus sp. AFS055030]
MKKITKVFLLLFLIVFFLYMYKAITTPKPIGYYAGEDEKKLSYNGVNYLYITSEVNEQIGNKLGIIVNEYNYQKKWINFDLYNLFSVKDEAYRLSEYGEKDYLVIKSNPIMESITSLYVSAEQKSLPIQFIPKLTFAEENKLPILTNDYFLVGSIRDENLIGNKLAAVEIENKSMNILSIKESVKDEWIALKNGDKYDVYSKKRDLLTSIPTKLYLELEI